MTEPTIVVNLLSVSGLQYCRCLGAVIDNGRTMSCSDLNGRKANWSIDVTKTAFMFTELDLKVS
jgi:hypothetical protein